MMMRARRVENMDKTKIIKKVVKPLKSLFTREEDFSKHLAENLDILSPILGVDLDDVTGQYEVPIGPFRCDILAQAIDETYIIIENQFLRSDHTHLGKLLTYITNKENVKIAVWICEEATEEHTEVVRWLNRNSAEDILFYLIEASVIDAGDDKVIIDLNSIVRPSKPPQIGSKVIYPYRPMLSELVNRFKQKHPEAKFSKQPPTANSVWIQLGQHRMGHLHCEWLVKGRGRTEKKLGVELHFENPNSEINEKFLNILEPYKPEIDASLDADVYFGVWGETTRQRGWRSIRTERLFGGAEDQLDEELINWGVESMTKLHEFALKIIDIQSDGENGI